MILLIEISSYLFGLFTGFFLISILVGISVLIELRKKHEKRSSLPEGEL